MDWIELKAALVWYPIFFGSTTTYYIALSLTTYSSALILADISSVFVFIFGLIILNESFSLLKFIAVAGCVIGVVIISSSEEDNIEAPYPILGDIIGFLSSIWLGLYSTMISKWIPPAIEQFVSITNFLGYIGILNAITFWPLLILFHYTGLEPFELPNGREIGIIAINTFFGNFLYDYCWGKSVLLVGPLLPNTVLILIIPISMIIDSFFINSTFTVKYYIGTLLILGGFIMIMVKNYTRNH